MGRPKKQIDDVILLQMRGNGSTLQKMSDTLGASIPTLSRRLATLHHEKGILNKFRQLQGLQLTELQARILETVDVKNFKDTSLYELLRAFQVLKKAEIYIMGKDSCKVWGLAAHLLALETLDKK